ncbi:hypothetical protein E1301_Tti001108 [Triplophysa tibetana]|uniref:Uncharacterized protein n=1 Tax=Triplophysa tibetana TaxID=1572043 RepID=A0A5A9N7N1_9TELE|nr:hypothetical protein E1301_Tti001108 [Triplophysa tibetana]
MSTDDRKLQQSTRKSGERDSVVSNHDRFYAHADTGREQSGFVLFKHLHDKRLLSSQDVSEDEKDFEAQTTATSLHLTGLQKSSRDLQIKQIILLRSNKDSSKTSEDQNEPSRFTAVLSLRFPNKRKKNRDTAEDTEEALLNDTDTEDSHETLRRTANKHHTQLRDRFSTTEIFFKDGDGPKSPFDENSFSSPQCQHGLTTPYQAQDTGIQHNIHERTQIANNDSQRHSTLQSICVIRPEFSKGTNANKESGTSDQRENVLTTPHYNTQLTLLGKDSSLKASADPKLFKCRSEVQSQVLSLAPFPPSGSSPGPEESHLNPASAMFASALVSVLVPPWSGRLRRPKQVGNELEQESQDCGQNPNPSTSLRQDPRQQPFLSSYRPLAERLMQEHNDNDTTGTSYSSVEWQKENNSPNISTTLQSKRAIMKTSSVDTYRGTMYNNAELHHVPTPLDTGQVPKSSLSEEHKGHRTSKTEEQSESFKSLSSKPTTSSLLLSLRRANLSRLNEENTQKQTPITRSVRSLTLPSRSILKNAKSYTSIFCSEEAGDTTEPYSFPDTPSRTEGISDHLHFLPRSKRVMTRSSLFLNKTDSEISKNPETFIARGEEHISLNSTTKSSLHEIHEPQRHSRSLNLLRKYTKIDGGDAMEVFNAKNTNQPNLNINNNPDTFSQISSNNETNSNIDIPQTGFNGGHLKSQNVPESKSIASRTFTDTLKFSPRKENFSVDGINTTNEAQTYQDTEKNASQSSQSPMDLSSPLSPSRPTKGFHVPSIYSYLRESSPAVSTSNFPSTPFSHIQRAESSSSPIRGGAEILPGDRKTVPSRFSFDIGPFESNQLKKSSSGSLTSPAQSLPPDYGRKSAPRLSTSPYSTLISSRLALNSTLQSLSSPPAAKPQEQSTSDDTITIRVYPIKLHPSTSSSMYKNVTKRPKEHLGSPDREQKTSAANTSQAYLGAPDNHKPAQPCLSQTVPHASFFTESQSVNITPHPRQQREEREKQKGSMAVPLNKDHSKHRLNLKENTVNAESKPLLEAEKETTDLQRHERLQEIPNSKRGLFALRGKKDNVFMADKDDVNPQYLKTKRNTPVLKTSSRIDQMLSRLKQTFGGKSSDKTVDTKTGNAINQIPLYTETFERDKREEKRLINDKTTLKSLSPATLVKSENMLNVDVQSRILGEKTCFGNSSLTNYHTSLPSLESLSPVTFRKTEKTLNVDGQSRIRSKKTCFGSQWEAPKSPLTTDRASLKSLSPLTCRKHENQLNVDRPKRWSDELEKQSYSSSSHRLNLHTMNRSATLPHYRNSSFSPSSTSYLSDYDSEDIQNENVFHSPVSKKSNSLCDSDIVPQLSYAKSNVPQNLTRSRLSSSCADLKYGLNYGRSFSVSSVVSSRPSGPGRISTSSVSDLSSLDDFMPKGFGSPNNISFSPTYGAKPVTHNQSHFGNTDDHVQNLDEQEDSSCFWDDADPTPPPSLTFSPSPRRMSHALAVSSPVRTTPESPPRGLLPSRSYSTSLTVFEESGSDTTTDDEYYLENGDDDIETEL